MNRIHAKCTQTVVDHAVVAVCLVDIDREGGVWVCLGRERRKGGMEEGKKKTFDESALSILEAW